MSKNLSWSKFCVKLFKFQNADIINIKTIRFFTFEANVTFTQLKQVFIKVLILQYFNLKYYIWIRTDIFCYTKSEILSQLISNDLSYLRLIAYFLKKKIVIKT